MHVQVVGAGLGGLSAALFLARRGVRVTIFEQDEMAPPRDTEGCFQDWRRRGVAQARQPHAYLSRAMNIYAEEAPDFVAAALEAGVRRAPLDFNGSGSADPDGPDLFLARRLVFESVLRRVVTAEPLVTLRPGARVEGLLSRVGEGARHITGVRLDEGEVSLGDLVVDASGRFCAVSAWLAEVGARAPVVRTQDVGLFYLTRWYRTRLDAAALPFVDAQPRVELPYGTFTYWPADNDTFCLLLTLSVADPLRRAVQDPEVFERVFRAVPLMADRLERGTAISPTLLLARIANARRRLTDDGGIVVSGYVLVGDAAMHTNPTLGRGVSLATAHAQHLAQSIGAAADDPLGFARDFDVWTQDNLGAWYDSQEINDAARSAEVERAVNPNAPAPTAPNPLEFSRAMRRMAARDPGAARAFARMGNLLMTRDELMADTALVGRVMTFMQDPAYAKHTDVGPTRAQFESLIAQ